MEDTHLKSLPFKLVIVGVFLASIAGSALCFKLSSEQKQHSTKYIRMAGIAQDKYSKPVVAPLHRDPHADVETELARAQSLQNSGKFEESEEIYKGLLNNHELLEIHDPLRITVCQRYAELLTRLGRQVEADRILDSSKHIQLRPEKDNHPARAHIS